MNDSTTNTPHLERDMLKKEFTGFIYVLYSYLPQPVDDKSFAQLVEQLVRVPWGHHRTIIDKCKGNSEKALFYGRRTIQNGWSRNSLLNWLSTDLYERDGNKISRRGILSCDVHCLSMSEAAPFFCGCQVNGKVFWQNM